jgi:hypothetical protein
LEADTTRTLNAALSIQHDQVAQRVMLGQMHLFFINITRLAWPEPHRQVLQGALATLIANRAIEWM